MKRSMSLLLVFITALSLMLSACNGNSASTENPNGTPASTTTALPDAPNVTTTGTETPPGIEITDGFTVIYNTYSEEEGRAVTGFIEDFKEKYGIELSKQGYREDGRDLEIQLGALKTRDEYKAAKTVLDTYSSAGIGVCVIRSTDRTLSVFGSTVSALEVGIKQLWDTVIGEDCTYQSGLDELVIFDLYKYERSGEIVGYTLDDLSKFSSATEIKVNSNVLANFSPDLLEYSYKVSYKEGYPTVKVKPLSKSATVTYEQASEANGGVATVTITSGDTKHITVYKIRVDMNHYYAVNAQIVNKGGAEGTVTYVIDDGQRATAAFAKTMLEKYDNLKLTFALMVQDLATLTTKTDGTCIEYVMDDDGRYTYTVDTESLTFWLDIKGTGKAEISSHTFTHAYHGTNDDGGVFEYVRNGEDVVRVSLPFPKGSSTKEILAAKQVLEDLGLVDRSLTVMNAGIGVRTQDYMINGRTIPTYKTYLNQILKQAVDAGRLIGTRSTFTVSEDVQLRSWVITPETAYQQRYLGVPAFMIEDYTDASITDPNYKSDINSWKAYIDYALAAGGWACFCIHNISNTQTGLHHINEEQADELFGYTSELGDRVAVMNFTEAMKYYHEWYNATVTATAYKDDYITLSVTDTLDDDNYDEALTVKVYLTDGWGSGAKYQHGSTEKELEIKTEGKKRYVLVDVVPDRGEVKIYSY